MIWAAERSIYAQKFDASGNSISCTHDQCKGMQIGGNHSSFEDNIIQVKYVGVGLTEGNNNTFTNCVFVNCTSGCARFCRTSDGAVLSGVPGPFYGKRPTASMPKIPTALKSRAWIHFGP
jgi:hypothetical protein